MITPPNVCWSELEDTGQGQSPGSPRLLTEDALPPAEVAAQPVCARPSSAGEWQFALPPDLTVSGLPPKPWSLRSTFCSWDPSFTISHNAFIPLMWETLGLAWWHLSVSCVSPEGACSWRPGRWPLQERVAGHGACPSSALVRHDKVLNKPTPLSSHLHGPSILSDLFT